MKKRWLFITAAVIVVFLLVLVALPFLIDVNRFKPQLEAQASAGLGRTVKVGDLSLSILSGRVVARDVEVTDDPAFSQSPFLTAKSVRIGVELKPLIFSRQLIVSRIVIEQPEIHLLKAADGTFNFSTLGKSSQLAQMTPGENTPPLTVARFNVDHGTLTFAHLNSAGAASVFSMFSDLNVEVTDFSRTSQFHFLVTTKLPGGGDANFNGEVGPLRFENVASTPFDAAATIHDMNISAYGLIDSKSGISGNLDMDGKVASDGSTATANGKFTASSMTFGPGGRPSPRAITIQSNVGMDLSTQSLTITQADVAVGKANFQMTGTIQSQGDKKTLNLRLTGKSVPIDELQAVMPSVPVRLPLNSHLRGGTLSINFTITGPMTSPVISGPVQVADTTLVGYNLGEQIGSAAVFAGKTISNPDTYIKSMTCVTTATLAGSKSTNIFSDIPSVATSTGSGTATPDGKLHYDILSYPTSGIAGGLVKMANVGDGKGAIPVTIEGTVEKPIFVTDTKAAAKSIVGQTAKGIVSQAGNVFSGLFKKKDKDPNKPDKDKQ